MSGSQIKIFEITHVIDVYLKYHKSLSGYQLWSLTLQNTNTLNNVYLQVINTGDHIKLNLIVRLDLYHNISLLKAISLVSIFHQKIKTASRCFWKLSRCFFSRIILFFLHNDKLTSNAIRLESKPLLLVYRKPLLVSSIAKK